MTLFRAQDLAGGIHSLREEVTDYAVSAVSPVDAGDQFWDRFDSILKTIDSLLTKYYAAQSPSSGGGSGTMEDGVPEKSPSSATFDTSKAAENIFDALSGYIGKIPFPDKIPVSELANMMQANRQQLVSEIAKGLGGTL